MVGEELSSTVEGVIVLDRDERVPALERVEPSLEHMVLNPWAALEAERAFLCNQLWRVASRFQVLVAFLLHCENHRLQESRSHFILLCDL
jgi:hypothetical protein